MLKARALRMGVKTLYTINQFTIYKLLGRHLVGGKDTWMVTFDRVYFVASKQQLSARRYSRKSDVTL